MALILNGTTQYAKRENAVVSVAPFTVSAFFLSTNIADIQAVWGQSSGVDANDYWRLGLRPDLPDDPLAAYIKRSVGPVGNPTTTSGYTSGNWHHSAFVEAGSQDHRVYIDGGSKGLDVINDEAPLLANIMTIGALAYNGGYLQYFTGKIAQVAIWGIALSDEEIRQISNGVDPTTIRSGDLIAYWELEDNADDSIGVLNLTLVGSPSFDSDVPATQVLSSSIATVSGAAGSLNLQSECTGQIAGTSSTVGGTFIFENYLLDEQSVQDGQPVELYLFDKDDGEEFWSYTSTDYDIVYDGHTYTAALIKRSDIVLDWNSLKTQVEVEVSLTNLFARNFIIEPIEGTIRLTIYRRHADSYVTYWKGYVRGVKFKAKKATIISGLKISTLKRFGLMRKFQRNCGLALYSTWCTILKTNPLYYVDGTINSVDGTTIDATIFGSKVDGWFLGGIFKTDNGSCLQKIVYHNQSESVIKISRGVSSLAVGDSFRAWAGCNHLKATCKDKFGNKLNYGGQPYLPDKNPFIGDAIG